MNDASTPPLAPKENHMTDPLETRGGTGGFHVGDARPSLYAGMTGTVRKASV